jgi:hypothetical protein
MLQPFHSTPFNSPFRSNFRVSLVSQLTAQLKSRHPDLVAKDAVYFNDFFFTRWLVARAWDLEQAHEMLTTSKAWREKGS